MSYRKAKLLLQKTKKKQQQNPVEQQEQQQSIQTKPKHSMFSMLGNDDSEQQQKNQVQDQTKTESKQAQNKGENEKKKKRKKNKKKKGQQQKNQNQQQKDEDKQFQQALKQMGMKVPHFSKNEQSQNQSNWKNIFHISEKKFDYEKQLRRHFKGWSQDKKQDNQDISKKQQKMQKHLRKMMKKSILAPGVRQYFPMNQKFEIQNEGQLIKFIPTKKYAHYQVQYDAIRNSNDINALFNFSQTHPQHVDSLYSVGQFLRLQGNYRQADTLIQRVIYIYQISGGYLLNQFIKNDYCSKRVIYDTFSTSLFMSLFKMMDILGKKGCFKAALQFNKLLLKLNLNDPTACLLCLDFNSISSKQYEFLLQFQSEYVKYQQYNESFNNEIKKQIRQKQILAIQHEKKEQSKNENEKDLDKQKQLQKKKIKKSLYFVPSFTYSSALSKFMLLNQTAKNQNKDLVINQSNIQNLLQFKTQHWEKALKISSQVDFMNEQPQVLIVRAIVLYPKLILDIAKINQFNKKFCNHQLFKQNQKKTFPQILEHDFWKLAPQSYSYHFLKLDSINDSRGLDKILQIYVERSKILWKSNQVTLFVKGAMGFVLNQIQRTKFDYEQFLINLCSEENVDFQIPFHLKRYESIFKGNFSDRVERIDMNNIQDNQGMQAQQPVGNPINIQGNPLALFLNSLLPWVNLPNVNNQNDEHDPDMPFIQDDQN